MLLSCLTPCTVQDPKGSLGFNSAECLKDRGRVGGKLTRTEVGKPQQDTLNSWKSGLKKRCYFLVSFFMRTEENNETRSSFVN